MAQMLDATGGIPAEAGEHRRLAHWWSQWPRWSAYAAAGWSALYAALALMWTLGGPGFPFGRADPEANTILSVLGAVSTRAAAPAILAFCLIATAVAVFLTRPPTERPVAPGVRLAVLGFGWTTAAALALVIPDYRLLMVLTRLPMLPVFAVTGVPGGHTIADFVPWPRLNLLLVTLGGALWAFAVLAYQRRTSGACGNCGRRPGGVTRGWTDPDAARRWGRWAVYTAAGIPLIYATTRIAWALGIRLGITDAFYRENVGSGMFVGGLAIAAMAVGGSILTLGLIQRWGERYPRWIWFKAGKPVPPALAIVPAATIAVFVMPAGLMSLRMAAIRGIDPGGWALTTPGWVWPLWSVALGAATYAYYLRRRSRCVHCGLD